MPSWLARLVRHRDGGCRFPGCGARAFTEVHHIAWWRHGGPTDLDNLLQVCSLHHRLVHEHRWSLRRRSDGVVDWVDLHGESIAHAPFATSPRVDDRARSPGTKPAA